MLSPGKIVSLQKSLEDHLDAQGSMTLLKTSGGMVTALAYEEGQNIEAHRTPYPAVLYVLSGKVDLYIDDKLNSLSSGDVCLIPAHSLRALKGHTAFQFLLVMLKDQKQDSI